MASGRPGSSASRRTIGHDGIDKLDYKPGGRRLVLESEEAQAQSSQDTTSYAGSFFEHVAEGVVEHDRAELAHNFIKISSFIWANLACLCAGSITAFSLYAPLFQTRLHYTQLQVNGISICAEVCMYLPVSLFGLIADRYGSRWCSVLAGILFGMGYIIAAFGYRAGHRDHAWPYAAMLLSFVPIGMATSCMYLSAVTTCAKNFSRSSHKGVALAIPIASFGLSGMWTSQVGSKLLYESMPDGSRGPVDVFRFFVFLGSLFCIVGIVGFFLMRTVPDEEYIDQAIDELEQSGLLTRDDFYRREVVTSGYGTVTPSHNDAVQDAAYDEGVDDRTKLLQTTRDEERRKKNWLLNEEAKLFLSDRNMWLFAAGFFLVTGPGETFINNLGSIIDSLYSPDNLPATGNPTDAATHVSIVALTSTIARILTGTLTDLLAPVAPPHQHRRGPNSLAGSLASLGDMQVPNKRFQLSRIVFLVGFSLLCALGQALLASGLIDGHAERFWMVSAAIGAGYGAVFSLTPIIIAVVWGAEGFGWNWGCVATVPALGALLWSLLYSFVYQHAATTASTRVEPGDADVLCYGLHCYSSTFWAMTVSVLMACGLWLYAWQGPNGWAKKGIAI